MTFRSPAGLDFETLSQVNLPKHGLHNYITHSSFRPLLASTAFREDGQIFTRRIDFVTTGKPFHELRQELLEELHQHPYLVAHNAGFERAVLQRMQLYVPTIKDSAVIARALGAGSKLEAAAPQLLGVDKLADGIQLMKKFSFPREDGTFLVDELDAWTQQDWDDWELYGHYCDIDATLSFQIEEMWGYVISNKEWMNEAITQQMNRNGWYVDLKLVQQMQDQYQENLRTTLEEFRRQLDPKGELNFRSTPQLRAWCKERGVRAKSFDELHTAKLLTRVEDRLALLQSQPEPDEQKIAPLHEVAHMLRTKQTLGGSSLSKLETIMDQVSEDGRLHDQYLHVGAGQTFRTSGRGVQMQNLKRLGPEIGDVDAGVFGWSNEELARNLRQVFTAEHPDGRLIVGDLASIESRGLAYLAEAAWKLDAYATGKDMYKVLAANMFAVPYEQVDKAQRQTGKIGELSCGYGAGPGAVARFAEKMGHPLTEEEAGTIVSDWRATNPEVVAFWALLDDMLQAVVRDRRPMVSQPLGPDGSLMLRVAREITPDSLQQQRADAQTICVALYRRDGRRIMTRWFQGCFIEGRDICYHKPSELKSGKLWHDRWTKDGQSGRYKLYGGKLAGILTQSFCRELFFDALRALETRLSGIRNTRLVGQFHDEIVVEWWPHYDGVSLEDATQLMLTSMTQLQSFPGFPMAAEVHDAHRYIK